MIGWLLDTNVISELAKPRGDGKVVAWALAQDEGRLFISVLTLAEYDKGVANLPIDAASRRRLRDAITEIEHRFSGRVLSVTDPIVRAWGRISGKVLRETRNSPPVIDTLLAATATHHDLFLVTRNVKDVRHSGAAVFDPWNDDPGTAAVVP